MSSVNYPKMLYKGEAFSDSESLKNHLSDKRIKTFIVSDEEQEREARESGFVSLPDLMAKRPTITLNAVKKADVKA